MQSLCTGEQQNSVLFYFYFKKLDTYCSLLLLLHCYRPQELQCSNSSEFLTLLRGSGLAIQRSILAITIQPLSRNNPFLSAISQPTNLMARHSHNTSTVRSTELRNYPQDSTGRIASQAEPEAIGKKDTIQKEIQQLKNEKL